MERWLTSRRDIKLVGCGLFINQTLYSVYHMPSTVLNNFKILSVYSPNNSGVGTGIILLFVDVTKAWKDEGQKVSSGGLGLQNPYF